MLQFYDLHNELCARKSFIPFPLYDHNTICRQAVLKKKNGEHGCHGRITLTTAYPSQIVLGACYLNDLINFIIKLFRIFAVLLWGM